MADNRIRLKRSAEEGKVPELEDLLLGELAVNTFDGKLFFKTEQEGEEEIVEFVNSVPVDNTFYVKKSGSDTVDGRSWDKSFATIEKALEVATSREDFTVINVGPGTYEVEGNLDMPDDCVIRCVYRTVVIRPKPGFEVNNVFRMGSGCYVEGFLFEDWQLDSLDNPTKGFAVSFRPGTLITRVPYAHKIGVRTNPYWRQVAPPLDRENANPIVGVGGGVALADGAVCSSDSVYPNIMTWGATPVSHNGIGYCAKSGGLINAVNAISIWAHKHYLALSGGQLVLSGCSNQFGDFALVADGSRDIIFPYELDEDGIELTIQTDSYIEIDNNRQSIIDNMWNALVDNGFTISYNEEKCERDVGLVIDAIGYDLMFGSNFRSITAGRSYYRASAIDVREDQKTATLEAFQELKTLLSDAVTDTAAKTSIETNMDLIINILDNGLTAVPANYTIPVPTGGTDNASDPNTLNARDNIEANRDFIKAEIIEFVAQNYPTFSYSESVCERDIDFILDALFYDLTYGGNLETIIAGKAYTEGSGLQLSGNEEKEITLDAYIYLETLVETIALDNDVAELQTVVNQAFTGNSGDTASSDRAGARIVEIRTLLDSDSTVIGEIEPDTSWVSSDLVTAHNDLQNQKSQFQTDITQYIDDNFVSDETVTRRDAGLFVQSIIWVLQAADEQPILDFAKGLFDVNGAYVFSQGKFDAFIFAFETMRDEINALSGVSATAQTYVTAVVQNLIDTLTNPQKRVEPSLITAIGHTWTGIFAGVALTKIPPVENEARIQDSILELNGGQVIASGQDDQGSAIFVGGLRLDADTGELTGPPFEEAVNRLATRASIARSY